MKIVIPSFACAVAVFPSKHKVSRTHKSIAAPGTKASINPKQETIYRSLQLRGGGADNSIDTQEDTYEESSTMKSCHCVLCGEEIIASCQEDCEAHMAVCPAFARVHPEDGKTNPNGVYPPEPQATNREETSKPQPDDIESMSVKELRKLISQAGLSDSDCIEKKDLQARAKDAISAV